LLIDNAEKLSAFVKSVGEDEIIGVDTEFMRERTYYSHLCLVQIATSSAVHACIDVIAIQDLSALQTLLLDEGRVKIFHAARQDLEVLFQRFGTVPRPVFDTQVAAGFCGLGGQLGYAALVDAALQIEVSKDETRTDWSQRPLSDAQLKYAMADVAHLLRLQQNLSQKLTQLKRCEWFEDEMLRLEDTELYQIDPEQAWTRIGAIAGLDTKAQRRAQRIARWREHIAQVKNLPRAWILKDRSLMDIAALELKPGEHLADVQGIDGLDGRFIDRWGDDIVDLLRDAVDDDDTPLAVTGRRLTVEENALRKKLMAALRNRAKELNVTPSLLGNRAEVERLIRNPDQSALLTGWRHGAIGAELLSLREQALRGQS